MANKEHLMTAASFGRYLWDKYGPEGMTAEDVYKECRISRTPQLLIGIETIRKPHCKRHRYVCGSVARWYCQNRIPEYFEAML